MAVTKIIVPKTPKSAFNKNRPASGLLLAQLEHLETASGGDYSAPKKKSKKPLTEGQVAARIYELTKTLHPHAAHVQMPTPRMISHAGEPGAVGEGEAPAGRKTPKKAMARKRGRKARKRG